MAIQRINLGTAPSGTGGDTNRSAFTKIDGNFADTTHAASRLVGTATGNVMEVGAFGLGKTQNESDSSLAKTATGFYSIGSIASNDTSKHPNNFVGVSVAWNGSNNFQAQFGCTILDTPIFGFRRWTGSNWGTFYKLYGTNNTQVDPNGFIKAASPIVSLYADKIELNDEAQLQPITFEKLGVGDYLIKGSTGFAQEGWYIEMPKDANGNVLVAVVYEQLDNNDISVKTYAKMFDEETGDIVPNTARPRDIPATRWIDLRLQALPQEDIQPLDTDKTVNTNAE